MASRASLSVGLSEADIRGLLEPWDESKPYPMVYLRGPQQEGSTREVWRAVCFLIRCREGGFMMLVPFLEEVVVHLGSDLFILPDGNPGVFSKDVEVSWETTRGRAMGQATATLVDCAWQVAAQLKKTQSLRLATASSPEILRVVLDEQPVRPTVMSVWTASNQWIEEIGEDSALADYFTAEEELMADAPEDPPHPAAALGARSMMGHDQQDLLQQLQARIVDLEGQLATRPSGPTGPARLPRELFPAPEQDQLDAQMWEKLKVLAGSAPPRLGRLENAPGSVRRQSPTSRFLEAEREAEVVEPDAFDDLAQSMTDPMQKLLALQLKQTNALVSRLAPKAASDPLAMALSSGSANESGSSGSGVRGCAAREVFVKQVEDASLVARTVLRNAQKDMGISDQAVYSGIMRDYMEKKVPLGDMKLLTFMATYLAHAWEAAYLAKDELMLGYISRGLVFVEQAALDAGRTQMAWLLVGLPEPNWAVTTQNRRRQALQPFARLAAPQWVAANVAFLKDLDFMEARLKGNKGNTRETVEEDPPNPDKPPRRPFPKRKPKGGEKGQGSGENAA